ncbi:MAG: RND family transporter [Nitrospina sp.]|nr:MAG: RND family transporter [Nitrospina sp.]
MAANGGFGEWVIRFRWWIILATLVMVAGSAYGIRNIGFTNNYRVFFSEENPQLQAFDALQNKYIKTDNAMISIVPKDGRVFSRETLALVEEVTRAAWQVPYSARVDSITNFQHTWAQGDDLVVEDLIENAAQYSDADLERVKRIALSEPLLMNRLINNNTDITAINITVNLPEKSVQEVPEVAGFIRRMVDEYRPKYPDIDFRLTGIVFMNNAFGESSRRDLKTLVPIMYLLIIVVMAVVLRSFWGTLAVVLVIAFSSMTAMGLAGWLGILLTPISANAPNIILTLAIADSIHVLITLFHEMRAGRPKREALIESLRVNHQPVFITSATTAIGFLSLNFSDSPPFRDLGNIVALGVMIAYVYSVLFLPAMIAVLPIRVKKGRSDSARFMDRLADFVIHRRRGLFWGMLVVILLILSQTPRLEIDEKFNEYFDTRYQFRLDNDYVTDHLTGVMNIDYSLGAGESGGISNPEYLAKLEEFAEWFRAQPKVMYVSSLTDVMKRLNKNMHGDDPAYYKNPEQRDLAAQYLLLYELSLPFGLDLNNQINVDKSSTRLSVVFENISTREALEIDGQAQAWLKENGLPSMVTHGASPLIMFANIAKRNIKSMTVGVVLALVLISLILVGALRSFKFGLVSMIPNLAPIFMTFGLWSMLGNQVGLAVSVAGPVALGIIVDDTVHFMSKYLRARREQDKNPADAVRYSFHTVGTALWVTSFLLVIGFSVLAFSGFTMNSHMGKMTVISVVVALITDFLFLPPLLMKLEGKPASHGKP